MELWNIPKEDASNQYLKYKICNLVYSIWQVLKITLQQVYNVQFILWYVFILVSESILMEVFVIAIKKRIIKWINEWVSKQIKQKNQPNRKQKNKMSNSYI